MKTLRNLLATAFVACFAFSGSAATIKEMIDNGTYYADPNYMWYDFKVSASDPLEKVYSGYTVNTTDNSTQNGWLLGWPAGDKGCKLSWNKETGSLVTKTAGTWSDNGFNCLQLKVGTPQLKYNTQAYPYIAIKFSHLPAFNAGGWQDGKTTLERMWGGIRIIAVERAATALTGANSDFWLRIPRNQADADSMMTLKNDDVANWLTVYTPNNQDTIYIFNLKGAIARNHANTTISVRTDAVIDFYLNATDVASTTDSVGVQWVRSFYAADEAIEYAGELYGTTGVKGVHELNVNIYSVNGKIVVTGAVDPKIDVYTFQGQKVLSVNGNEASVPAGNYIVKVTLDGDTKVTKLTVK